MRAEGRAGWRSLPLEECMAAIIDYRGKSPNKVATGVPLITAKVVKNGRIDTPNEFIDPAEYDSWMRRGLPHAGDVLITTEAPLGEVAQLDGQRVALAQRLICLRARGEILDELFLKYLMQSEDVQAQLRARATGTTVLGIKQSELRKVILTMPPLDEQRAVGGLLGALDEKIELNRRMNQTLEAMARALFRSWFVDFDPVRTKREGRLPVGMDADTAALFPDRFEQSELGEVPRGWRVGPYGAGLTLVKGKSYKSDELQPSRTALVTLKSFLRGGGYREDGLKEYVGEYKPEQVVLPGEVVVAFTDVTQAAEVIGRPARVRADARYSALVASLDVGIVRPKARELPPEYLYYCFLEPRFTDHTYAHANGSTVLHLAAGAVEKFEGIWPDAKVASAFVEIVGPLLHRQDANWAECDTLAKLRDVLLPKLLSGELRVRDADRIVDRAV